MFANPPFGAHLLLTVVLLVVAVVTVRSKPNRFVGVRNRWTLGDDVVWRKANRFGGIGFAIAAAFAFIGAFIPPWGFWFLVAPPIGVAIATTVYSWQIYQKREHTSSARTHET